MKIRVELFQKHQRGSWGEPQIMKKPKREEINKFHDWKRWDLEKESKIPAGFWQKPNPGVALKTLEGGELTNCIQRRRATATSWGDRRLDDKSDSLSIDWRFSSIQLFTSQQRFLLLFRVCKKMVGEELDELQSSQRRKQNCPKRKRFWRAERTLSYTKCLKGLNIPWKPKFQVSWNTSGLAWW